jgi:hypothetical protein
MLVAIRALSLVFIHLLIIAGEADLILAVARVEVLLLLLESCLAHIANVLPFSHDLRLLFFRTVLQRFFVRVLPKLLPVQSNVIFGGVLLWCFFGGIVIIL